MRDFNHIMDRVEREIEEIMGEKKWTPQHAQALEELLMCEKCVKEIEKMAHAKKRMMGLPAPTEEEDEEMMQQPWHFEDDDYGRENYTRNDNYVRGRNNYERNNYTYRRPIPIRYHYPPFMEEDTWDPRMGPVKPHMYGGNQHMYGWDPMMQDREWSRRKGKHYYDEEDDDEDEEERRMKKRNKKHEYEMYEHSGTNGEGTSGTASTGNSQNGSTTGTNTTGARVVGK